MGRLTTAVHRNPSPKNIFCGDVPGLVLHEIAIVVEDLGSGQLLVLLEHHLGGVGLGHLDPVKRRYKHLLSIKAEGPRREVCLVAVPLVTDPLIKLHPVGLAGPADDALLDLQGAGVVLGDPPIRAPAVN